MKGKVVITMPIDAVGPDDARDSARHLIARWLGGQPSGYLSLAKIEAWLREHTTFEFVPDPPATVRVVSVPGGFAEGEE